MQKRVFTVSVLLTMFTSLAAQGVDKSIEMLLDDYRIVSDLSNQTRQEAAGSVIVYSRDQLEKMQAYNLRDILKTIPMFTLQETMTGPVTIAKAMGASFNSQFLKLYINDHELGSIVYGSAMKMWGYMDITHIDHIEVYQMGSSVEPGDEPPGMVIRLYTKEPKRDAGSQVQMVQSSRGSSEYNAYHAGTSEGLSYLLYLNVHDEQRQSYHAGNSSIGRDFESTNFFASLSGENFQVDVARFSLEQDGLLGLGRTKQPIENYLDMEHTYLAYTHYLQNRTLQLKASYDAANHIRYDHDPSGIALNDGTVADTWFYDKDESILEVGLSKKFAFGNNDLQVGLQFKRKEYDPVSLLVDATQRAGEISPYRRFDVYSLFMAQSYTLDENNLLFATLKFDSYSPNAVVEKSSNFVARAGYIYNDGRWLWKSFAVRTYSHPVFMESSYFPFIFGQNEALDDEERYALATELHHKGEHTTTRVRLGFNRAEGPIYTTGKPPIFASNPDNPEFYGIYISHEHRFDLHNKIILSGYTSDNDRPLIKSSRNGVMFEAFNSYGSFDLYNGVIYRSGYAYNAAPGLRVEVDPGYDYTAALSYHASDDLTLSLKGENLLNNAIETAYPIPARNTVEYIAPFDRTVRFGIKYVF